MREREREREICWLTYRKLGVQCWYYYNGETKDHKIDLFNINTVLYAHRLFSKLISSTAKLDSIHSDLSLPGTIKFIKQ